MTRISFRVLQLAPHESISGGALAGLVGQRVMFHAPGKLTVSPPRDTGDDNYHVSRTDRIHGAVIVSAEVKDGWVVATADFVTPPPTEPLDPADYSWAYMLPDVARALDVYRLTPPTFTRSPSREPEYRPVIDEEFIRPDWATAPRAFGPARFERVLDQGLAPVADERWWYDRCADASGERFMGPEFRWPPRDWTRQ